ncbi:14762_t:CDS:2, partial [Funneliformis caledonium]
SPLIFQQHFVEVEVIPIHVSLVLLNVVAMIGDGIYHSPESAAAELGNAFYCNICGRYPQVYNILGIPLAGSLFIPGEFFTFYDDRDCNALSVVCSSLLLNGE